VAMGNVTAKPSIAERIRKQAHRAREAEDRLNEWAVSMEPFAQSLDAIAQEIEELAERARKQVDLSQRPGASSAFLVDCYELSELADALAKPKEGA